MSLLQRVEETRCRRVSISSVRGFINLSNIEAIDFSGFTALTRLCVGAIGNHVAAERHYLDFLRRLLTSWMPSTSSRHLNLTVWPCPQDRTREQALRLLHDIGELVESIFSASGSCHSFVVHCSFWPLTKDHIQVTRPHLFL